ncbi:hypothetical protein CEP51_000493 [Fusarium floridanum]|uniref:Homeobox domain-containing protein n=1 Tax=Fusarium floridanum TaxID=1325733 RepID=A0A428SMD1_9HYPO|nr:hypothetical protein CEP51_000493 [Fusarium floridanum]
MDGLVHWQAEKEPDASSQPHEPNEITLTPDIDTLLTNIHSDELLPPNIDFNDIDLEAIANFNEQPSQDSSSCTDGSYPGLPSFLADPTFSQAAVVPPGPPSLLPPSIQATTNQDTEPSQHYDDVGLLSTILSQTTQKQPIPSSMPITEPDSQSGTLPAKIGNRFSKDALQILKRWLALHSRYPYPTDQEKEILQRQTGLTKTQISNWFTNTRRKRKSQPQRNPFSHTDTTQTGPIDINRRPGTPAVDSNTNPLQRWVDSPPESEPASVTAIARAVASSWESPPRRNSHYRSALTDEESDRSFGNGASASSAGTSSGSSFASAHTHRSGDSFGSVGNINKLRNHRRRRRRVIPERKGRTSLINPQKPYQCTFCAEAFRTKHDWQRHEKSLHLSLERWVCTPKGPRAVNPRTDEISCVFCGMTEPDDAHLETHNHTACKVRPVEDKSFYRKDHINQHLKLVHDAQFVDWSMKSWKIVTSEIRSRCGFCGLSMNTWPARVEHLAEHFKHGSTMADWKGDWGFDAHVLDMLESSIPPYLIEMERTSPFPFTANSAPADSPTSAYELITLELAYFIANYKDETGSLPTDEELQLEACRVIFASEASSRRGISAESSWLRDLLMGDEEITRQAQFAPLRHGAENRLCVLKINGKDNLFEQCPLEGQLREFAQAKAILDIRITDSELQEECCYIIGNIRGLPIPHYDSIADWLIRLVMSSAVWLVDFRQRAHLPRTENLDGSLSRQLELEGTHIHAEGCHTADDSIWPSVSRPSHSRSPGTTPRVTSTHRTRATVLGTQSQESGGLDSRVRSRRSPGAFEDMMKKTFFMNDSNCYRRLAQELTRFVMATMSPNNPNQHVPSDAEIQYQARWILFESDDAWNQTAADNDEWLQRFKRDVGILPGLGIDRDQGAQ